MIQLNSTSSILMFFNTTNTNTNTNTNTYTNTTNTTNTTNSNSNAYTNAYSFDSSDEINIFFIQFSLFDVSTLFSDL